MNWQIIGPTVWLKIFAFEVYAVRRLISNISITSARWVLDELRLTKSSPVGDDPWTTHPLCWNILSQGGFLFAGYKANLSSSWAEIRPQTELDNWAKLEKWMTSF